MDKSQSIGWTELQQANRKWSLLIEPITNDKRGFVVAGRLSQRSDTRVYLIQ